LVLIAKLLSSGCLKTMVFSRYIQARGAHDIWCLRQLLNFRLLQKLTEPGFMLARSIEGAVRSSPGLVIFPVALVVFLSNGRTISGDDSATAWD
jgi:hypothetical protein